MKGKENNKNLSIFGKKINVDDKIKIKHFISNTVSFANKIKNYFTSKNFIIQESELFFIIQFADKHFQNSSLNINCNII